MPVPAPAIAVVVHPVDVAAHPSVPPGFRWAVQVGGLPPSDVDHCVNAGWCPNEREAAMEGEMVGVAVAKALRMYGVPVSYALVKLDHDPIPAGSDRVMVG